MASSSARSRAPAAFPPTTGAWPVVMREFRASSGRPPARPPPDAGRAPGTAGAARLGRRRGRERERQAERARNDNRLFIAAPSERRSPRRRARACPARLGARRRARAGPTGRRGRRARRRRRAGSRPDRSPPRAQTSRPPTTARGRRARWRIAERSVCVGRRAPGRSSQSPKRDLDPDHRAAVRLVLHVDGARAVRARGRSVGVELACPPRAAASPSARAQLGGGRRARAPLGARARQVDAGHAQIGGGATGGGAAFRPPVDGRRPRRVSLERRKPATRRAPRRRPPPGRSDAKTRAPPATPTRSSRGASTRCHRRRG